LIIGLLLLSACSANRLRDEDISSLPVSELYGIATQSVDNGNFTRAERLLKRLISLYPFGPYTEQAQLKLAYVQFRQDLFDEATASINRFIKTYPTHAQVDYAYYLRGLINFDRNYGFLSRFMPEEQALREQNSNKQAFTDFQELVKRFPESSYAADARQRMVYLRNTLAKHELSIAQYYLRRGAYVGALNRAKNLVETYQEAPQANEALVVMVRCYEALQETELAADTLAVLKLNAPDHPYLSGQTPEQRGWFKRLWPFSRG
jgi:outer membrane protein assembly factor BamD